MFLFETLLVLYVDAKLAVIVPQRNHRVLSAERPLEAEDLLRGL
jgi:hypothetical protein